jgi:ribonuclease HI
LEQSNISLRCTDNHSIFTAELTAIKLALEIILHVQGNIPDETKFIIYSDSLSSLKAIQSSRPKGNPSLLNQIFTIYQKIKLPVQLTWIPSHIGITGNEKADQLANQSINHPQIEINIKYEWFDVVNKLRQYINHQWQQEWNSSNSFYRSIQPTVSRIPKFCNNNRKFETFVSRLRLGRARLNHYLFAVGRHSTGHCDSCGVPETITHHLLFCNNKLSKLVKKWCDAMHIPHSIADILNNHQILNKIYSHNDRTI